MAGAINNITSSDIAQRMFEIVTGAPEDKVERIRAEMSKIAAAEENRLPTIGTVAEPPLLPEVTIPEFPIANPETVDRPARTTDVPAGVTLPDGSPQPASPQLATPLPVRSAPASLLSPLPTEAPIVPVAAPKVARDELVALPESVSDAQARMTVRGAELSGLANQNATLQRPHHPTLPPPDALAAIATLNGSSAARPRDAHEPMLDGVLERRVSSNDRRGRATNRRTRVKRPVLIVSPVGRNNERPFGIGVFLDSTA